MSGIGPSVATEGESAAASRSRSVVPEHAPQGASARSAVHPGESIAISFAGPIRGRPVGRGLRPRNCGRKRSAQCHALPVEDDDSGRVEPVIRRAVQGRVPETSVGCRQESRHGAPRRQMPERISNAGSGCRRDGTEVAHRESSRGSCAVSRYGARCACGSRRRTDTFRRHRRTRFRSTRSFGRHHCAGLTRSASGVSSPVGRARTCEGGSGAFAPRAGFRSAGTRAAMAPASRLGSWRCDVSRRPRQCGNHRADGTGAAQRRVVRCESGCAPCAICRPPASTRRGLHRDERRRVVSRGPRLARARSRRDRLQHAQTSCMRCVQVPGRCSHCGCSGRVERANGHESRHPRDVRPTGNGVPARGRGRNRRPGTGTMHRASGTIRRRRGRPAAILFP